MRHFRLKKEHLKLLKNIRIYHHKFGEHGGLAVDSKRPFGNCDMVGDMAGILGVMPVETDDNEIHWPKGTRKRMEELYAELATALQVIAKTNSCEPGDYAADEYVNDWEVVPF